MANSDQITAMRRKAGAGRPPPAIRPASLATATRNALARAGEDTSGLVIMSKEVRDQHIALSELDALIAPHSLLGLIEGEGSSFGMFAADPGLVSALIEIQTTGRVTSRAPEERKPTRTDAVICSDFLDRFLERLETELCAAQIAQSDILSNYRYAMAVDDLRALSMTLEDVPYFCVQATVDLGQGAKEGQLTLMVPVAPPAARPKADGSGVHKTPPPDTVMGLATSLEAVLCQLRMPLRDVTALEIGTVIPISRDCLTQITLRDLAGGQVGLGKLGQQNGHRALRLGAAQTQAPSRDGAGQFAVSAPQPLAAMPAFDPNIAMDAPPMAGVDAASDLSALPEIEVAPMNDLAMAFGDQPAPSDLPDLPDLPDLTDLPDLPMDFATDLPALSD